MVSDVRNASGEGREATEVDEDGRVPADQAAEGTARTRWLEAQG